MVEKTKLSVNVNKVALLRNSRHLGIPSVLRAASLCIAAGAEGITVHPRPDERHIRRSDVRELSALIRQHHPHIELNIEGNPLADGFLDLVFEVVPDQCTMVPDSPEQSTSDHGWNVLADREKLVPVLEKLRTAGIRSSLFLDPDVTQVAAAKEVGADRIELYTEPYASSYGKENAAAILEQYVATAKMALEHGLGVNAGHDLNLENLGKFLREVPAVLEVSIGHALIADALELGYATTVAAYQKVIREESVKTAG